MYSLTWMKAQYVSVHKSTKSLMHRVILPGQGPVHPAVGDPASAGGLD